MRRLVWSWLPRVGVCLALGTWVAVGADATSVENKDDAADRKIAPQDILTISIVGEKDMQADYPVSASGTIQFPFLETVEVKGKTTAEVRTQIQSELGKDYFVDPQVIVNVKEYRKEYVRVIGNVNKPGLVLLPSEQKFDILDAIAAAGGLDKLASKGQITLTRKGKSQKYSLKELKNIKDPDKRVWLQADDTIEVGESVF